MTMTKSKSGGATDRTAFAGWAERLFKSFWLKHYLSRWQWYRKWHGGRWEYHWIDIYYGAMWLHMTPPRVWPDYVQPCSHGTPIIEDWPNENGDSCGN